MERPEKPIKKKRSKGLTIAAAIISALAALVQLADIIFGWVGELWPYLPF